MSIYDRNIARFYPIPWMSFHMLFWVLTSIFSVAYFCFFDLSLRASVITKGIFLPTQMIAAYIIIFFFLKHMLFKDKYIQFILSSIVFLFIFSLLSYVLYDQVINGLVSTEHKPKSLGFIFQDIETTINVYLRVIFLLPLILICFEIVFYQYAKLKFIQYESQETRTAEAEYLKLRFKPAYIVSTLRNLSSMIDRGDQGSMAVLEKLSETLDYILYRGRDEHVMLEKEIDCVQNYLELERHRMDEGIKIESVMEIADPQKKIFPMHLLSFIEGVIRPVITGGNFSGSIVQRIMQSENELSAVIELTPEGGNSFLSSTTVFPEMPYRNYHELSQREINGTIILTLDIHYPE